MSIPIFQTIASKNIDQTALGRGLEKAIKESFHAFKLFQVNKALINHILEFGFVICCQDKKGDRARVPENTTLLLELTKKGFQKCRNYIQNLPSLDMISFRNLRSLDLRYTIFDSWDRVYFPPEVRKLNLSQTNFFGHRLQHLLHLKVLNLNELKKNTSAKFNQNQNNSHGLKETKLETNILLPPNLIELHLNHHWNLDPLQNSNLSKLQILSMRYVKIDNWNEFIFPKTLVKLDFNYSNFNGNLSNLILLENASLHQVNLEDWSTVRFPTQLKTLHLSSSNCCLDLSYLHNLETLYFYHVFLNAQEKETLKFPEKCGKLITIGSNI